MQGEEPKILAVAGEFKARHAKDHFAICSAQTQAHS